MKLVDMKPAEGEIAFGLRLTLGQEQLEALGLDLPPAGTELHIEAVAIVTSSSTEDPDADGDVDFVNVSLQLTQLGVEKPQEVKKAANPVNRRQVKSAKLYNPPDKDGGGNWGPFGALVKPVGG